MVDQYRLNIGLEFKRVLAEKGNYKSSKDEIVKIIKSLLEFQVNDNPIGLDSELTQKVANSIYIVIKYTDNSILDNDKIVYFIKLLMSFLIKINTYKYLETSKNENIALKKFLEDFKERKLDKSYYIEELEKINKVFIPKSKYSKKEMLNLDLKKTSSLFKCLSIYEKIRYFNYHNFIQIEEFSSYYRKEFSEKKTVNVLDYVLREVLTYYTDPILAESEKTQRLRFLINVIIDGY